jgi:hypothetical protein
VNRDIDGIPLQEAAAGRTILARGQKTAKSAAVPRCIDSSSLIASGAWHAVRAPDWRISSPCCVRI